ncbi:MAG: hypothetical protein AB1714_23740 [Acidobacteriota bacterium]
MITEDGLGVYYSSGSGPTDTILFQKLKSKGRPSGAPITAGTTPGEYLGFPRIDAERKWMSYIRGDGNIWVTRLSATGTATGTPVKVTSVPTNYYAFGGLTRSAGLLVYMVWGGSYPHVHTLYSQRLDANGNPTGAPLVLVATTSNMVSPWAVAYW